MTNKPNADSANDGSLAGQLDEYLAGWVRDNLDDMLPAVVISYDEVKNRAILRPLVMIGTTDNQKLPRARIENIPVFRYGAGEFFVRFPVKPGDFGWIKANDRDISLVLQRGGLQDWPNTKRRHNFSDAMFYPDHIKDWVVDTVDYDCATFQSLDGVSVVSIAQDNIEIRRGEHIIRLDDDKITTTVGGQVVTVNLTSVTAVATADVTLTVGASSVAVTPAAITLTSGGTLVLSAAGLFHNGVNIGSNHTHDDVEPGNGTSGTPTS